MASSPASPSASNDQLLYELYELEPDFSESVQRTEPGANLVKQPVLSKVSKAAFIAQNAWKSITSNRNASQTASASSKPNQRPPRPWLVNTSFNGNSLAVVSEKAVFFRFRDVDQFQQIAVEWQSPSDPDPRPFQCAWNADGTLFALVHSASLIFIIDNSGQTVLLISAHDHTVSADVSPAYIATALADARNSLELAIAEEEDFSKNRCNDQQQPKSSSLENLILVQGVAFRHDTLLVLTSDSILCRYPLPIYNPEIIKETPILEVPDRVLCPLDLKKYHRNGQVSAMAFDEQSGTLVIASDGYDESSTNQRNNGDERDEKDEKQKQTIDEEQVAVEALNEKAQHFQKILWTKMKKSARASAASSSSNSNNPLSAADVNIQQSEEQEDEEEEEEPEAGVGNNNRNVNKKKKSAVDPLLSSQISVWKVQNSESGELYQPLFLPSTSSSSSPNAKSDNKDSSTDSSSLKKAWKQSMSLWKRIRRGIDRISQPPGIMTAFDLLPPLSSSPSPFSWTKLSISTNGSRVAALDLFGRVQVWSITGHKTEENSTKSKNDDVASGIRQRKEKQEAGPAFSSPLSSTPALHDPVLVLGPHRYPEHLRHSDSYVTDISWWSDDALIVARSLGDVCVLEIESMRNLLGSNSEQFKGLQLSVTDLHDSGFCILNSEEVYIGPVAVADDNQQQQHQQAQKPLVSRFLAWSHLDTLQPRQVMTERKHRLAQLCRVTPEERLRSHVENGEYGDATRIASMYNLNPDVIYQAQWERSSISEISIRSFLDKIGDKLYVLGQAVTRTPPSIKVGKILLSYGCELSMSLLRKQCPSSVLAAARRAGEDAAAAVIEQWKQEAHQEDEDDEVEEDDGVVDKHVDKRAKEAAVTTEEQFIIDHLFGSSSSSSSSSASPELILLGCFRFCLLKLLDRIETFRILHQGSFDPIQYEDFRRCNLAQLSRKFARACNFGSLQMMMQFHFTEMQNHLLDLVSSIPETVSPSEYQHLLPPYVYHNKEVDDDDDEPSLNQPHRSQFSAIESPPIVSHLDHKLRQVLAEKEQRDDAVDRALLVLQHYWIPLSCLLVVVTSADNKKQQQLLDADAAVKWYCDRAHQIDARSNQIDRSLQLLEIGSRRTSRHASASSTATLQSLRSCVSLMNILVFKCNALDLSLASFESLSSFERFTMLLSGCDESEIVSRLQSYGPAFMEQAPSQQLLRKYMVSKSKHDLSIALHIIQASKPNIRPASLRIISDDVELLGTALDCIYACEAADQLPLIASIFECLPERRRRLTRSDSLDDDSEADDDDDEGEAELQDRVDILERQISAAESLSKYNVAPALKFFQNDDGSKSRADYLLLIESIFRTASKRGSDFTEAKWRAAIADAASVIKMNVFFFFPSSASHAEAPQNNNSISLADMYRIACESLLKSGLFELAKEIFDQSLEAKILEAEDMATVALTAAREYFNSALSAADSEIQMAEMCLSLLESVDNGNDVNPAAQEEVALIEAARTLLEEYDLEIPPVSIRVCKDRMTLIEQVFASSDKKNKNQKQKSRQYYRNTRTLTDLCNKLGLRSEQDHFRALLAASKCALDCQDYAFCFTLSQQLITTATTAQGSSSLLLLLPSVIDLCKRLALEQEFDDPPRKLHLLSQVLAYSSFPPSSASASSPSERHGDDDNDGDESSLDTLLAVWQNLEASSSFITLLKEKEDDDEGDDDDDQDIDWSVRAQAMDALTFATPSQVTRSKIYYQKSSSSSSSPAAVSPIDDDDSALRGMRRVQVLDLARALSTVRTVMSHHQQRRQELEEVDDDDDDGEDDEEDENYQDFDDDDDDNGYEFLQKQQKKNKTKKNRKSPRFSLNPWYWSSSPRTASSVFSPAQCTRVIGLSRSNLIFERTRFEPTSLSSSSSSNGASNNLLLDANSFPLSLLPSAPTSSANHGSIPTSHQLCVLFSRLAALQSSPSLTLSLSPQESISTFAFDAHLFLVHLFEIKDAAAAESVLQRLMGLAASAQEAQEGQEDEKDEDKKDRQCFLATMSSLAVLYYCSRSAVLAADMEDEHNGNQLILFVSSLLNQVTSTTSNGSHNKLSDLLLSKEEEIASFIRIFSSSLASSSKVELVRMALQSAHSHLKSLRQLLFPAPPPPPPVAVVAKQQHAPVSSPSSASSPPSPSQVLIEKFTSSLLSSSSSSLATSIDYSSLFTTDGRSACFSMLLQSLVVPSDAKKLVVDSNFVDQMEERITYLVDLLMLWAPLESLSVAPVVPVVVASSSSSSSSSSSAPTPSPAKKPIKSKLGAVRKTVDSPSSSSSSASASGPSFDPTTIRLRQLFNACLDIYSLLESCAPSHDEEDEDDFDEEDDDEGEDLTPFLPLRCVMAARRRLKPSVASLLSEQDETGIMNKLSSVHTAAGAGFVSAAKFGLFSSSVVTQMRAIDMLTSDAHPVFVQSLLDFEFLLLIIWKRHLHRLVGTSVVDWFGDKIVKMQGLSGAAAGGQVKDLAGLSVCYGLAQLMDAGHEEDAATLFLTRVLKMPASTHVTAGLRLLNKYFEQAVASPHLFNQPVYDQLAELGAKMSFPSLADWTADVSASVFDLEEAKSFIQSVIV